jgi:hypothetical protein
MTDDELTELGQQHYRALCASFAQTWREVFDSPLFANILNRAFEEFQPVDIATWEGEGGR